MVVHRRVDEVLHALEIEAVEGHVPILRGSERELLLAVARDIEPHRILEVGTAIGYSSLLLAREFPHASIDTIEVDDERYERACAAWQACGYEKHIHGHLGDAAQILPTLSGLYDFVFLDGPKGQYLRHVHLIEPLLAPRAIIAADNVLYHGWVEQDGPVAHKHRTIVMRLRAYIDYVEKAYDTTIYRNGDGLAVSRKGME